MPTLTLQPDAAAGKDNAIQSLAPAEGLGLSNTTYIGNPNINVNVLRTLIQFDISSIPAGATITAATLSLYCTADYSSNARTFRAFRLKRAWVEGVNGNPPATGSTWQKYDVAGNLAWQTAGGFGVNDCEQVDIGSRNFTATETINEFKSWSLTPSAVQEWYSGAFANNGLLLKADTENQDCYGFASSDHATAVLRPTLVIEYTLPAAGGLGRIIGKSGIFGGVGIFHSAIFGGAGGAPPVIPWYLSGGIAAANCIAAYTPKGAASLAASYDNNAAPGNGLPDGTYDAAPGVAPAFNAATGWTFAGAQYLLTAIPVANNQTAIVQFTNAAIASSGILFGANTLLSQLLIRPYINFPPAYVRFQNGGSAMNGLPNMTSGNLAVSRSDGYRNGVPEGLAPGAWTTGNATTFYIGALNTGGAAGSFLLGSIQAFAIYNVNLTAPQVAAVAAAMAAL